MPNTVFVGGIDIRVFIFLIFYVGIWPFSGKEMGIQLLGVCGVSLLSFLVNLLILRYCSVTVSLSLVSSPILRYCSVMKEL